MEESSKALAVHIDDIDSADGLDISVSPEMSSIFTADDNIRASGKLDVNLALSRHGDDLFAIGTASGDLEFECGRCLQQCQSHFKAKVQVAIVPEGDAQEKEDVYTYQGDTINLSEILREESLLIMPLKQICSEDCKGLCPKCGVNLNKGGCSCHKQDVDGPFSVLKKLKKS